MGFLDRLRARLHQTDEELLAREIEGWAGSVPGTVRMAEAPSRVPVKLAGVVKRITVTPIQGAESLEAVLSDGTGEVVVEWMGRRTIRGLNLGTRVVVTGTLGAPSTERKMVNPRFEFAT